MSEAPDAEAVTGAGWRRATRRQGLATATDSDVETMVAVRSASAPQEREGAQNCASDVASRTRSDGRTPQRGCGIGAMSSDGPPSSGASGDDAHFDDAVSPLAHTPVPHGLRSTKRQASRTLSGRLHEDPELSPLAAQVRAALRFSSRKRTSYSRLLPRLQHAETKHVHLDGDIHGSGAAAAGHESLVSGGHSGDSQHSHRSEEDTTDGPLSAGAGARGA